MSVAGVPAPTPRKRRRWSFVLTAVLLGLVVAAVALELAFRIFWQPPFWFTDFQTMAKPSCASAQLFSRMFPSASTRCAFLSSKRFFTVHTPFHDGGLKK